MCAYSVYMHSELQSAASTLGHNHAEWMDQVALQCGVRYLELYTYILAIYIHVCCSYRICIDICKLLVHARPSLPSIPPPQGTWAPRKIDNPAFFEDKTPFFSISPIGAIGFELWTMNEDIYFDNVIITSELTVANNYAAEG